MHKENQIAKIADLIYDVGMCKGEDTDYYLKKGFSVIGFEADPKLVEYCRNRFLDEIEREKLIIFEGAIVDLDTLMPGQKKVSFYRNKGNPVWGTACSDWASRNEMLGTDNEIIEVAIIDFAGCLKQYGVPHYMKIDIEGCDIVCLKSLFNFALKPDYISLESEKTNFQKLIEEIEILEQLGYGEFKAIQQEDMVFQSQPNFSLEGKTITYQFQKGCSGLFGKDLAGEWKNKRQILEKYKKIFLEYRLFGDYSFLNRLKGGEILIRVLQRILNRPLPGWYDTHAKHSSVG